MNFIQLQIMLVFSLASSFAMSQPPNFQRSFFSEAVVTPSETDHQSSKVVTTFRNGKAWNSILGIFHLYFFTMSCLLI